MTGFGFAGHALALARESGVDLVVQLDRIPVLEGAREALATGLIPAGAYRNRDAYQGSLEIRRQAIDDVKLLLCDPQTSGGLLVALPRERTREYLDRVGAAGVPWVVEIGEVSPGGGRLVVE